MFLKLDDRPCLVVGGGKIGERKTLSLIDAGADVTLVSPYATEKLERLAETGSIQWLNRSFQRGDGKGYFLIIAATDSKKLNREIHKEAMDDGSLVNCVSDPDLSNFFVPASVDRGSLKIAISTEGKSPILAKRLKALIGKLLPVDIEEKVERLGHMRREILQSAGEDEEKKKQMFQEQIVPYIDEFLEGRDK